MITHLRPLLLAKLKLLSRTSKILNLGAGGTWPGELALKFDPTIVSDLAKQLDTIVLVAGTNGKTTTAKMVATILELKVKSLPSSRAQVEGKLKVIHNETGANLLNGISSELIKHTDFSGKLTSNTAVFEIDENSLPLTLKEFTPTIVILLNLFRDQLDRYGEVDLIAEKWLEALKKLPSSTTVIINADDPHLAYIGSKLKAEVLYFGLGDKQFFLPHVPYAVDTVYCPNCGKRLVIEGYYLSHLSEWKCAKCNLVHPGNNLRATDVASPLIGIYNIYNTLAATLTGLSLKIPTDKIHTTLSSFTPAFGRQEEFEIDGKKVKILLSKNPAGFTASLSTVLNQHPKAILLVLNDRIPDGRDVSWIWDVDFEMIPDDVAVVVSGDRVYDMAVRMKYARVENGEWKVESGKIKICESVKDAIEKGLKEISDGETLYVLPTYSAMLEVRKILSGRKIL